MSIGGAVGATPPRESLRHPYRSDEATLEKAPPRALTEGEQPRPDRTRKSLRFQDRAGRVDRSSSTITSSVNLERSFVPQRF